MDWLDSLGGDPRPEVLLTSAIIAALVLGPMIKEGLQGRFSIWSLKTGFLLIVMVQFSVWPLYMYMARVQQIFLLGITFWTSRYDEFVWGQWCVIAGLIAFYIGYYLRPHAYAAVVRHRWFDRATVIPDRGYLKIFWGSVVITAIAFAAMMASTGGVVYFLQNIDTLRTTAGAGWGVFLLPIQACQVGCVLYMARSMEEGKSLFLPIAATLLQAACGFVVGQRALLLAPIAGILLCYHVHVRPIRFSLRQAAGLIAFLLFNMWYTVFRGTGDFSLDSVSKIPVDVFALGLLGRFHGSESLARIVQYTDHTGFNFAIPYLKDYVVQTTPRFLYPEKTSIGVIENITFFPETFNGTETGSAVPSLMGELYWAGGIVAIVLALYAHGRIFRRAEEDLKRPSPIQTTIYWCLFSYILIANESIDFHTWLLLFRLGTLAALIGIFRVRVPHRTVEDPSAEPI